MEKNENHAADEMAVTIVRYGEGFLEISERCCSWFSWILQQNISG